MSPHPTHQSQPPEHPLATILAKVEALVQEQLAAPCAAPEAPLPRCTRSGLREGMDHFVQWHWQQYRQVTPSDPQQALLEAAFNCIADVLLAQPMVSLSSGIARLTRDASQPWAEDVCLDVTIRYWEKARKAGLPVNEDFGEFYRSVEWTGLHQHLTQAGHNAQRALQSGEAHHTDTTPQLISHIRHTCHRYRELRPMGRLVETLEGIEVAQSYAFGRT